MFLHVLADETVYRGNDLNVNFDLFCFVFVQEIYIGWR